MALWPYANGTATKRLLEPLGLRLFTVSPSQSGEKSGPERLWFTMTTQTLDNDIRLAKLYRTVKGHKAYRIDRVNSGFQVSKFIECELPGIDPKNPHAEVAVLTLDTTMIVRSFPQAVAIVNLFIR